MESIKCQMAAGPMPPKVVMTHGRKRRPRAACSGAGGVLGGFFGGAAAGGDDGVGVEGGGGGVGGEKGAPSLGFLVNSETRHTEGANNQISE